MKEQLWTVARFPNGFWSTGGKPTDPDYAECEVFAILATSREQAKKKAQARRSTSMRKAAQAEPADALDASPVAKRLLHGHEPWEIPAQTIQRDAVRYRWLRTQFWDEGSMCVVMNPKSHVVLGAICPSHKQLDSAIDAAMAAAQAVPAPKEAP